jgi:xanthine permease
MSTKEKRIYKINDFPPLLEAIPLGLQHILVMFSGNITVPLIVAGAIGLATGETGFWMQCAMFASGITTLIQTFGLGPVGGRMPIVMGLSFTFVSAGIAIATMYGLSALFGSILVCGLIEAFFGYAIIKRFQKYFPPVVTGTVVLVIGLALLGTGITEAAGGFGAANFGSLSNYALAAFTLVLVIVFQQFGKGMVRAASVLIALIIGYIISAVLGMVDFSQVADAAWIAFPQPLRYGISFNPAAIGIMFILFMVSMMEFIGDATGTVMNAEGREPTQKELLGGILCDGLGSSFSALFNSLPNVSFSQNVGLIGLTGVGSRYIVGIGGIILTLLAFFPKLGVLIALVPKPVLGGACIAMFGMIASSGIKVISLQALSNRNLLIIAVSLAIGMGFAAAPDALANYPFYIGAAISGIPGAGITAFVLNLLLPNEEVEDVIVQNEITQGKNTEITS